MNEIITCAEIKEGKVHVKIQGKPADSMYLAWVILRDTAKALEMPLELFIAALLIGELNETHQP